MTRSNRIQHLLQQERSTRERIKSLFPEESEKLASLRDRLPVTLVLGSPRGGTSPFKAALAKHRAFLTLAGEHRLFFTLIGLNYPDYGGEEESLNRPLSPKQNAELLDMIFSRAFINQPVLIPNHEEQLRYAWEWAYRLPLQWSACDINPDDVVARVLTATRHFAASDSDNGSYLDELVFEQLEQQYQWFKREFYDGYTLSDDSVQHWPSLRHAGITPVIEITPFVVPRPRKLLTHDSQVDSILLKASSDPYRFELLRNLFQNRPLNIIRLTRNPLSSCNGLLDGWKHSCFWQHDLSDIFSPNHFAAGWCFDLYPGWKQALHQNLLDVVGQQWVDSNRTIEACRATPLPNEQWLHCHFEDFIRSAQSRESLLLKVIRAINLPEDADFSSSLSHNEVVNSTKPAKNRRWVSRQTTLLPLLDNQDIANMAEAMGYQIDEIDNWL